MNTLLNSFTFRIYCLIAQEKGQDLVEYALVMTLIAFGAIAGMGVLAIGINSEFSIVAAALTSRTS